MKKKWTVSWNDEIGKFNVDETPTHEAMCRRSEKYGEKFPFVAIGEFGSFNDAWVFGADYRFKKTGIKTE